MTAATCVVTVALASNPTAANLTGMLISRASGGVASFSNLKVDKAGTGYRLQANSAGLQPAVSLPFTVSVGTPVGLVFRTQPTRTVAGAPFNPAVQIAVVDAAGNTVRTATGSISLSLAASPVGATLSGTLTRTPVSGVATFYGVRLNKAGAGYALQAAANGLPSARTAAFSVIPGPAARLAFTRQPSNAPGGAVIAPAVKVSVQDAYGNLVGNAPVSITMGIGLNGAGGRRAGTATVRTAADTATFGTLSIDRAGRYTLTATAPGLPVATSLTFSVVVGPAYRLVFAVEPSGARAGTKIAPAIQVAARDRGGNAVISTSGSVSVYLSTNPTGAVLTGTRSAAFNRGIARFADLAVSKPGSGYVLRAGSVGVLGVYSAVFKVDVGITVSVLPSAVTLGNGRTQAFRTTVTGTTNTAVTWRVTEGAAGGTITSSGVYTAPAVGSGVFHVVATSKADPTKCGSAAVTLTSPIAVQVIPATVNLPIRGMQAFRATVTGTTNTAVSWRVEDGAAGGTITSSGVYTAPASAGTYHVVARSAADTTRSGSATVTVSAGLFALPGGGCMEMVSVAAGAFQMGNSGVGDDLAYGAENEKPQHQVTVSAYSIGKCEVKRGQFRLFITAGGYSNSAYWSSAGWAWRISDNRTQPDHWAAQQDWGTGTFTQTDNHPVVGVSNYEAEAFCRWAGLRLPTEAEWERAARWDGFGRIYPWANTWDPEKLNCLSDTRCPGYRTAPVGIYPTGASAYGCLDMAGNVAEWCSDWIGSYSGGTQIDPQGPAAGSYRVVRGGNWASGQGNCRAAYRGFSAPANDDSGMGFRCAKSP